MAFYIYRVKEQHVTRTVMESVAVPFWAWAVWKLSVWATRRVEDAFRDS